MSGRFRRRYGNYGGWRSSRFAGRRSYRTNSRSLRARARGNQRAANQQADVSDVIINLMNTCVSMVYPISNIDPTGDAAAVEETATKEWVNIGTCAINIFDLLKKSDFFNCYAPMYDQFRITKVQVKITPVKWNTFNQQTSIVNMKARPSTNEQVEGDQEVNYPDWGVKQNYQYGNNEYQYPQALTVVTAWDRTGLDSSQFIKIDDWIKKRYPVDMNNANPPVDQNLQHRQNVIDGLAYVMDGVDGIGGVDATVNEYYISTIGDKISTYSSAQTKQLVGGASFNCVRYLYPSSQQEKSLYFNTNDLVEQFDKNNNSVLYGYDDNIVLDSNRITNYLSNPNAPFKPTLLIGILGDTDITKCDVVAGYEPDEGDPIPSHIVYYDKISPVKFNLEFDIGVTFRGLRKTQVVLTQDELQEKLIEAYNNGKQEIENKIKNFYQYPPIEINNAQYEVGPNDYNDDSEDDRDDYIAVKRVGIEVAVPGQSQCKILPGPTYIPYYEIPNIDTYLYSIANYNQEAEELGGDHDYNGFNQMSWKLHDIDDSIITWNIDDNNNTASMLFKLPVSPLADQTNPNLPADNYIGFKNNQLVQARRGKRKLDVRDDSTGQMVAALNMFTLVTLLSNLELNRDNTVNTNLQMRSITNVERPIYDLALTVNVSILNNYSYTLNSLTSSQTFDISDINDLDPGNLEYIGYRTITVSPNASLIGSITNYPINQSGTGIVIPMPTGKQAVSSITVDVSVPSGQPNLVYNAIVNRSRSGLFSISDYNNLNGTNFDGFGSIILETVDDNVFNLYSDLTYNTFVKELTFSGSNVCNINGSVSLSSYMGLFKCVLSNGNIRYSVVAGSSFYNYSENVYNYGQTSLSGYNNGFGIIKNGDFSFRVVYQSNTSVNENKGYLEIYNNCNLNNITSIKYDGLELNQCFVNNNVSETLNLEGKKCVIIYYIVNFSGLDCVFYIYLANTSTSSYSFNIVNNERYKYFYEYPIVNDTSSNFYRYSNFKPFLFYDNNNNNIGKYYFMGMNNGVSSNIDLNSFVDLSHFLFTVSNYSFN